MLRLSFRFRPGERSHRRLAVRDYVKVSVPIVIVGTFVLLMVCFAAFLESWDDLSSSRLGAFAIFLLCFIVLPLPWTRVFRPITRTGKPQPSERLQPVRFSVPFQPSRGSTGKVKDPEYKQLEREQTELDKFLKGAAKGQYSIFNALVTGVTLLPNENCCAVAQNVEYLVPIWNTAYIKGSQALSFRIAEGARYEISTYKGRAVAVGPEAVRNLGCIYVTSQRMIFVGAAQVVIVQLQRIKDVCVYSDGVAVYRENKRDPFIFRFDYGSSILAAAIRAMVDHALPFRANQ